MTKLEAQRELAESLILLAEALLADEGAGQFKQNEESGEIKITSVLGNSTTIVAVKNWTFVPTEDEWAEYIEV